MNEQDAMISSARCAKTSRMGSIKLPQRMALSLCRSLSSSALRLCDTQAHSKHTTATTTRLSCQLPSSAKGGTTAPANMLPKGTPVCLMENTSDIWCLGVVRASRCELAGVIGP